MKIVGDPFPLFELTAVGRTPNDRAVVSSSQLAFSYPTPIRTIKRWIGTSAVNLKRGSGVRLANGGSCGLIESTMRCPNKNLDVSLPVNAPQNTHRVSASAATTAILRHSRARGLRGIGRRRLFVEI